MGRSRRWLRLVERGYENGRRVESKGAQATIRGLKPTLKGVRATMNRLWAIFR